MVESLPTPSHDQMTFVNSELLFEGIKKFDLSFQTLLKQYELNPLEVVIESPAGFVSLLNKLSRPNEMKNLLEDKMAIVDRQAFYKAKVESGDELSLSSVNQLKQDFLSQWDDASRHVNRAKLKKTKKMPHAPFMDPLLHTCIATRPIKCREIIALIPIDFVEFCIVKSKDPKLLNRQFINIKEQTPATKEEIDWFRRVEYLFGFANALPGVKILSDNSQRSPHYPSLCGALVTDEGADLWLKIINEIDSLWVKFSGDVQALYRFVAIRMFTECLPYMNCGIVRPHSTKSVPLIPLIATRDINYGEELMFARGIEHWTRRIYSSKEQLNQWIASSFMKFSADPILTCRINDDIELLMKKNAYLKQYVSFTMSTFEMTPVVIPLVTVKEELLPKEQSIKPPRPSKIRKKIFWDEVPLDMNQKCKILLDYLLTSRYKPIHKSNICYSPIRSSNKP
jgi:hypothetical protein